MGHGRGKEPAKSKEPKSQGTQSPDANGTSARPHEREVLRTAREKAEIEALWPKITATKITAAQLATPQSTAAHAATPELARPGPHTPPEHTPPKHYKYIEELAHLQYELIKLQEWVRVQGLKVAVIFEGRDAAGKGGVIKRIAEPLNPRSCRVVALGTPTERERGQWFFQRYVAELPAKGEIVLFDRSWYNRAGVERVMGFCTEEEYREFLRACPLFEEMLIRSGIVLIKYWFSVSDEEQEKRFNERAQNPFKRWKLSPMDLEFRARWVDYSKAKDVMFAATDTRISPWNVVDADDKKRARLNAIAHLLAQVPYQHVQPAEIELPPRQPDTGYRRPKKSSQHFVPKVY